MREMISSGDTNEVFNSVGQALGTALAAAGVAVLIALSAMRGKWLHLAGFAIYGSALVLCFLFSTLLHSFLAFGKYKKAFGVLDHVSIYLLIAGTYTPVCLVVLRSALGWAVLGAVWLLAIVSIIFRSVFFDRMNRYLVMATYLSMGWLAVLLAGQVYGRLGAYPLLLFILAGAFYTVGSVIFFTKKPVLFPPYFSSHEIWHVFVFLGNLTNYLVMLLFVLPFGGK